MKWSVLVDSGGATHLWTHHTKGLRLDARDQPLPIGSLLDFSYDCRYCSIVTKDMVMNGHECDRHHPLQTITNRYCLILTSFSYTGPITIN